jgi:hypothetical protein
MVLPVLHFNVLTHMVVTWHITSSTIVYFGKPCLSFEMTRDKWMDEMCAKIPNILQLD